MARIMRYTFNKFALNAHIVYTFCTYRAPFIQFLGITRGSTLFINKIKYYTILCYTKCLQTMRPNMKLNTNGRLMKEALSCVRSLSQYAHTGEYVHKRLLSYMML